MTPTQPGRATSDICARIDDAVEQRCACGCGAALAPEGPSGWFATEACQRRWSRTRADAAGITLVEPDEADRILQMAARQVAATIRGLAEAIQPMLAAFEKAELIEAKPPEDPMQRALWLRRNRNTGPPAASRVPRRIDPRRAR